MRGWASRHRIDIRILGILPAIVTDGIRLTLIALYLEFRHATERAAGNGRFVSWTVGAHVAINTVEHFSLTRLSRFFL